MPRRFHAGSIWVVLCLHSGAPPSHALVSPDGAARHCCAAGAPWARLGCPGRASRGAEDLNKSDDNLCPTDVNTLGTLGTMRRSAAVVGGGKELWFGSRGSARGGAVGSLH